MEVGGEDGRGAFAGGFFQGQRQRGGTGAGGFDQIFKERGVEAGAFEEARERGIFDIGGEARIKGVVGEVLAVDVDEDADGSRGELLW